MEGQILKAITSSSLVDFALRLAIISGFVWSIAGAIVFIIKGTRSKRLFGAEFDPEKPHTDRRAR